MKKTGKLIPKYQVFQSLQKDQQVRQATWPKKEVKIRLKMSQIGYEDFCENIQNIFLWAAADWLRDVGSGNTGEQL